METCLQPLWNLLREPCNQLMEISDFEDNSNRQILMQKRKDLLTECEDILHIFWKDPDEFINLKKPKHIATLSEVINIAIKSEDSAKALRENIQLVIDQAANCGLCARCRGCAINFYNEIVNGQFKEKNLPYELKDYFSFKPQMHHYKEYMYNVHTHTQIQDSLLILKGFSSSTPTVHSAVFDSTCSGGGIYINYRGNGIAIDPGIGFVKLMHEYGVCIEDINTVIITHDHLDHNADAETISSLVYDYNSYNARKDSIICDVLELDKSSDHEINWIMDGDSYDKLKNKIPNSNKLDEYQKERGLSAKSENIILSSIHTQHIKDSRETYGIKLRLQYNQMSYTIGYTSDTAYFEELPSFFKDVDVLIFNVSDIYKKDVKGIKDKRSHLGYNGSLKILSKTKAKIAVASEFCCTNGDFRMNFVRALKNELRTEFNGVLLPGEIGMKISIPNNYFECSVCRHKVLASEIHALDPEHAYGKIRYVCSKCML